MPCTGRSPVSRPGTVRRAGAGAPVPRPRRFHALPTRRSPCSTPIRRRTRSRVHPFLRSPSTRPHRTGPPRSAGDALFAAARSLLPVLEAGRPLDAATLRECDDECLRRHRTLRARGSGRTPTRRPKPPSCCSSSATDQRHAPPGRRRAGPEGPRTMLRMLDGDRRTGAVAYQALRGTDPPPAVLDAAAARLCRPPGCRDPSGRHRAGALGRHRHAGGDGRMRDGHPGRRQSPSERVCANARPPPDPALPAGAHHRLQRGSHRRPASRRDVHGRHHESAVFRHARRRPHPPRRRSSSYPVGLHHAAAGRPARHHHLGPAASPATPPGATAFGSVDGGTRVVFTMAIAGRAYARRGTGFDTRLTVIDRSSEPGMDIDREARAANAAELLDAVIAKVPPRLPITQRRPLGPSRPVRPGTCSARRSSRRPQRAAPAPIPLAATRDRPRLGTGRRARRREIALADTDTDGPAAQVNTGPYAPWTPGVAQVPGAIAHPTPLVQSAAMVAVPHPVPSWRPILPERLVTDGLLSDAQLESVVLAGEAHSPPSRRRLPYRLRLGDRAALPGGRRQRWQR